MRDVVAGKTQRVPLPYMSVLITAWDAGYDAILRNAPVLVVACSPKEASNGMVDLTLALSYLDLAWLLPWGWVPAGPGCSRERCYHRRT